MRRIIHKLLSGVKCIKMERMRVARLCLMVGNGNFLLLKRPSDKYNGDLWELPGGKLNEGELDWELALRREVLEETGIETREGIVCVFQSEETVMFKDRNIIYEERVFREEIGEEVRVVLSDEHTDGVWVDREKALGFDLTLGARRFLKQEII